MISRLSTAKSLPLTFRSRSLSRATGFPAEPGRLYRYAIPDFCNLAVLSISAKRITDVGAIRRGVSVSGSAFNWVDPIAEDVAPYGTRAAAARSQEIIILVLFFSLTGVS